MLGKLNNLTFYLNHSLQGLAKYFLIYTNSNGRRFSGTSCICSILELFYIQCLQSCTQVYFTTKWHCIISHATLCFHMFTSIFLLVLFKNEIQVAFLFHINALISWHYPFFVVKILNLFLLYYRLYCYTCICFDYDINSIKIQY